MEFKKSFPVVTGLLCILLLPYARTAWSQEKPLWTLTASVQRALDVAPELRAAQAEIAVRAGELSQAGAWPNPTIELRADEKKSIETQNRRGVLRLNQITLTQPIPLRRLEPQRRAAALTLESAQAEQRYQNLQIETRTAQAYHALQRAAERQRLAQERLGFAEKMQRGKPKKDDPLVRYLSPLERARLDVLRQTAYQEVAEAEGKWSEATAQLRALLALAPGAHLETLPLTPATIPATLAALLDRLTSHPALQAAQHNRAASQAGIDVARAQRLADPTVGIFHEQDELAGERRIYSGIMLSMQIPVWNKNGGSVARAIAATDKADAMLAAQRRDLESRLRQNHLHLGYLIEQAEHYSTRLLVPAKKVLDLTRKGFATGEQNGLALVDASNTYFEAQAHYLDLLHDAWFEAAELRLASGVSLLNSSLETQP
ncbi:MAG: TolC family protein [Gallionellaceae bacterium]|nr:TolC family protein [Gallionellaceae bacterium]